MAKFRLKPMNERTVYVADGKQYAIVPAAHERSIHVNQRMLKDITLTEDHDTIPLKAKMVGVGMDETDNMPYFDVESDEDLRQSKGLSPGFVPIDYDENGLVKSYYLDHLSVMKNKSPAMPLAPGQITLIEGSIQTEEDEDMTTNAELEAELKVSKKETAKLEKKLEAMQATVDELAKAKEETAKDLKEKLKAEQDRTKEYEQREKKKLLDSLPDDAKALFGETEEEQLTATIIELERAVKLITPKEPAPEEPEVPEPEQPETPEPGKKKIKLPPAVPAGGGQVDDDPYAEIKDIDKALRKQYGYMKKDDPEYEKTDVSKHSDFIAKYNVNVR